MQQVSIRLSSMEEVQRFVKTLTPLCGDFEVISGHHILDARSMMGLFSLDFSAPITLKVFDDCPENLRALAPFLSEQKGRSHE